MLNHFNKLCKYQWYYIFFYIKDFLFYLLSNTFLKGIISATWVFLSPLCHCSIKILYFVLQLQFCGKGENFTLKLKLSFVSGLLILDIGDVSSSKVTPSIHLENRFSLSPTKHLEGRLPVSMACGGRAER